MGVVLHVLADLPADRVWRGVAGRGDAVGPSRPGSGCARSVRIVPGAIAVRPMIVVIRQLISCGITTKTKIRHAHAAPRARGKRALTAIGSLLGCPARIAG